MRDYISREKLVNKCFISKKIGHLTKKYRSKVKLCPKCNSTNRSGNYRKANWKCRYCGGNHSAAYKGFHSYKSAISKSLGRHENISYAQAVWRRAAKETIEAFKANVVINLQQLIKIIATVIWKINNQEFDFINHLTNRVVEIVREIEKLRLNMASFNPFF